MSAVNDSYSRVGHFHVGVAKTDRGHLDNEVMTVYPDHIQEGEENDKASG